MKRLMLVIVEISFWVALGYGMGAWDTMRRVSELCKPGASWVTDGVEYQCTVTVRQKPGKVRL